MNLNKIVKNAEAVAYPQTRYFEVSAENFAANGNVVDIDLPINAEVIGGHVNVTEAFDAATSDVLDVGDPAAANRYANDVNLKATGRTAITPTGFITSPTNHTLRLTRVPTGATSNTAGAVRICVQYVQLGFFKATQG